MSPPISAGYSRPSRRSRSCGWRGPRGADRACAARRCSGAARRSAPPAVEPPVARRPADHGSPPSSARHDGLVRTSDHEPATSELSLPGVVGAHSDRLERGARTGALHEHARPGRRVQGLVQGEIAHGQPSCRPRPRHESLAPIARGLHGGPETRGPQPRFCWSGADLLRSFDWSRNSGRRSGAAAPRPGWAALLGRSKAAEWRALAEGRRLGLSETAH